MGLFGLFGTCFILSFGLLVPKAGSLRLRLLSAGPDGGTGLRGRQPGNGDLEFHGIFGYSRIF